MAGKKRNNRQYYRLKFSENGKGKNEHYQYPSGFRVSPNVSGKGYSDAWWGASILAVELVLEDLGTNLSGLIRRLKPQGSTEEIRGKTKGYK